MRPQTKYAKSGNVNIAYQVVGTGTFDLVYVMGWVSNLDYFWAEPSVARFFDRLASFSRLILLDKRGTGLSDRVPESELPTLEQRMDDVRAVMDAVGSERAALFGVSEGGPMCALFAATYPARTISLLMYGSYAKRIWASDYPWAPTPVQRQKFYDAIAQGWGGVVDLATLAPSAMQDERFKQWWASYLRLSASPGAALALARMNTQVDIRHVLPAIRVPTLILHRTGDLDIDVGGSRYMAGQIPGAKYVELPGNDHLPWVGDQDMILDEVEEFLTGVRRGPEPDRVLATVLFADIVRSTERVAEMGTVAGGTCWTVTTHWCAENLTGSAAERSTPQGMVYWQCSMDLREPFGAPAVSGTRSGHWASRFEPDYTRAKSNSRGRTSAASLCTSAPASSHMRDPAK